MGKPVLIETLWNVKVVAAVLPYINGLVLIETLWNVKKEQQKAAQDMTLVLIETLWNVKTAVVKAPVNASRINRNIVECKERHI